MAVTWMRRFLILCAAVILTGCVTVTESDPSETTTEATARSEVEGVETWDLDGARAHHE